jgi:cation transport protein ChaC
MMCLDRGGQCEGVALRLGDDDPAGQIGKLLYREVGSHEALESVRWIDLKTDLGPVRALCFYAHPHLLDFYSAGRPLPEVAHSLVRACGHWGSGAEYLYNITVSHLSEIGIHDDSRTRINRDVDMTLIANSASIQPGGIWRPGCLGVVRVGKQPSRPVLVPGQGSIC